MHEAPRIPSSNVLSRTAIAALVVVVGLTLPVAPALGYPGLEAIHSANGDGTDRDLILPLNLAEGRGELAVDGEFVFWTGGVIPTPMGYFAKLRRARLDGTERRDIGPGVLGGIAVDQGDDTLYLTPQSDCAPECTALLRVDRDGSNGQWLYPAGFPGAIAVHPALDRVCWWDSSFDDSHVSGIRCANIGDAEAVTVLLMNKQADGLEIDPLANKIYFTSDHAIRRINLDGTDLEVILDGLTDPLDLALDPAGGLMWWTEPDEGAIWRANLDGSDASVVVADLYRPTGIGFVPGLGGSGRIYWLSAGPPPDVPAASPTGILVLLVLTLAVSAAHLARHRR